MDKTPIITTSSRDGLIIGENGFPTGIRRARGYVDERGNYVFHLTVTSDTSFIVGLIGVGI